jgi:hypothetical protein
VYLLPLLTSSGSEQGFLLHEVHKMNTRRGPVSACVIHLKTLRTECQQNLASQKFSANVIFVHVGQVRPVLYLNAR